MFKPLNSLRRTGQTPGTAPDGFVFFSDGMSAAFRTDLGKLKFDRIGTALFFQNLDDLRNNVAGSLNDNRIADADVFAFYFILIVKRSVRNDDAADVDRFQIGNGGQGAGAADLNSDVVDAGYGPLSRKFMRCRPAWRSCQVSESFLQGPAVDLVNNSVDIVRQVGAYGQQIRVTLFEAFGVGTETVVGIGRKTPALKKKKKFALRLPWYFRQFSPGIGEKAEFALSGYRSVKLPERPGRRVARIGKKFFSFSEILFVQRKKVGF